MKRTRITVIVALLATLVLSGCGGALLRADAATADDQSLELALAERYPFKDFPKDAYPAETQTAKGGKVTPTKLETDLFQAKFEGDEVSGSGGAVGGAYHFIAEKTDGEAWHVKLECNYPTIAGRDYFVTYNFRSDVAGTVKFGDFQEFQIQAGENSITGVFTATSGQSYLDLQLGMLPAFTIDFTDIEVKEYADEVSYENAIAKPVNFERASRVYEKHDDGYSTYLSRGKDAVNVNYISSNLDSGVWKSRLYVRTGMVPELGTHYRVTADVMSDQDMPIELLFNDGDVEKGYGALYGLELEANKVTPCEAVITGVGNGDELVLQFSLGEAPEDSMVTVGNVHVEKIVDQYTSMLPEDFALDSSVATGEIIDELVPVDFRDLPRRFSYSSKDTVYEQHDDGYVVNLKETVDTATIAITRAPANPDDRGVWKVRLYAATGVKLDPNMNYLVKFDLESKGKQSDYEVVFDGDYENAYGALYGRSLEAGGTDHVEQLITPDASHGPLTVRVQLGKTDTAAGNTVTLKNFSVEAVKIKYKNVLPASFSYDTGTKKPDSYKNVLPDDFSYSTAVNVFERHADGYTQSVSASGKAAKLNIKEAPSKGRDLWNSNLLINTGFTPKAGQKYLVTFDIVGKKDQPKYEVCYDGDAENAYGALYDRELTGGKKQTVRHSFTPEKSAGPLVLRLQLGQTKSTSGNVIKVSNIQIKAVTSTAENVSDISYKTDVNVKEEHGDEIEQTVSSTDSSATLNVTKAANGGGVWSSKLFVETGVTPKAGASYRVSATVSSEKDLNEFEVVYNNGGAEDGYGHKRTGLSVAAGASNTVETDITMPGSGCEELVLLFQLGKTPADNKITVSDIKICEISEGEMEDVDLGGFSYPTTTPESTEKNSFDLEVNNGAEAKLTGNGTSATAKVIKSGDDWHIKFYAKPGIELEAGTKYQISMDVAGGSGSTAFYKNTATGAEDGFGTEAIGGDGTVTVTHTVTPAQNGTLEIMLKLGTLADGTEVTVSNVKIEKETTGFANVDLGGFAYPAGTEKNSFDLEANNGAEAKLTGDGSSATATVIKSGDDWHIKFYAKPGIELEAGTKYQISADITGASGASVCYKRLGGEETDFGTEAIGGDGTVTVTHTVTPAQTGTLEIMLKLGTLADGTEVTVSNVKIEKETTGFVNVELTDFEYPKTTPESTTESSFSLETNEGTEGKMTGDGSSATAKVIKHGDDWHIKFYAKPGIELEAGTKYQISMDVAGGSGSKAFYKNTATGVEDGFGTEGVGADGPVTHTVTPTQGGTLEIILKLGALADGSEVTVSNVKIEKATKTVGDNQMKDALYAWAPVNFWAHDDYKASLTNNDSSATLKVNDAPASEREPWKTKLFVETGTKLKAGKTYRISAKVKASAEFPYEICYNNGAEEKGVGAKYELTASTSGKTVTYDVTPEADSDLIIQFSLGNATKGTTVTVSGIKVEELSEKTGKNLMKRTLKAWAPVHQWVDDGYKAKLTNNDSSATMSFSSVAKEKADWKAKLFVETGAKLKAGKTYRIRYDLEASKSFKFNVFYNNGAEEKAVGEFYDLKVGKKKTITHTVSPANDAELTLQLMLGNTTAPNKVKISNLKVEEAIGGSSAGIHPINHWAHEDYTVRLSNTDKSATAAIKKVPSKDREAWKVKLFVETGAQLKAGKTYRVSMDVKSSRAIGYEIAYNNQDQEAQLGAQYDLSATSEKSTVTYTVKPEQDAVLIAQLNLGNATGATNVTVSNVKVQEMKYVSAVDVIPNFRYNSVGYVTSAADDGYVTSLAQYGNAATFRISHAPAGERKPWNAKVNIRTGVTPAPGKGCRVTFDVDAAAPQDLFEVFYDGNEEMAYGALYEKSLAAGKNTFTFITAPNDGKGELYLQLRFGQTNGTNGNAYTISNVKIEEVTFIQSQRPEIKDTCELDVQEQFGYAAELAKTSEKAKVRLLQTPEEELEAWKNKLFVNTGAVFQPGEKYRVGLVVRSIIPAPFEVCYNNRDVEKGLGGIFGLTSKAEGVYVEYTTYCKEQAQLVIQLSLGNCTTPNTIFLSDVKVDKAGKINLVSDKIYTF